MSEAHAVLEEAPVLRLNPELDVSGLAEEYAAKGRVRIHRLLDYDGVAAFYHHLNSREDWWHLVHTPDGVIELDREARAALSPERAAEIEALVQAGARSGFQYRYEGLRVPNDAAELAAVEDDPLGEFARLMSSEPMLEMLRGLRLRNDPQMARRIWRSAAFPFARRGARGGRGAAFQHARPIRGAAASQRVDGDSRRSPQAIRSHWVASGRAALDLRSVEAEEFAASINL
jgi:hypothetical protein